MPLTRSSANGWDWIRGADNANTPLPLGPTANCVNIGNRHYLGYNARYKNPLFVRAYFDPTGLNLSNFRYVGYVQVLEARVLRESVPPEVFGGLLAGRTTRFLNVCLDFMGPGDALARQQAFGGPVPPFYPLNAMLTSPLNSMDQFSRTNAPMGFLFRPNPPSTLTGNNVALAASITAQIDLSLLTESQIIAILPRENILGELSVALTNQELAAKTLIQHAIDLIRGSTNPNLTQEDKAIAATDIRFSPSSCRPGRSTRCWPC
jgi:hypothetical protein